MVVYLNDICILILEIEEEFVKDNVLRLRFNYDDLFIGNFFFVVYLLLFGV